MTDKCREYFEKWYIDPDCKISQRALRRSDENPNGYALMQAQSAWQAFQAAYNLREQEVQRLRGALIEISQATEIYHGMYAYCADKYVLDEAIQALNHSVNAGNMVQQDLTTKGD